MLPGDAVVRSAGRHFDRRVYRLWRAAVLPVAVLRPRQVDLFDAVSCVKTRVPREGEIVRRIGRPDTLSLASRGHGNQGGLFGLSCA